MDEAAAGYGKKITVVINRDENRATVVDEGRGIPFKKNAEGKWAIMLFSDQPIFKVFIQILLYFSRS